MISTLPQKDCITSSNSEISYLQIARTIKAFKNRYSNVAQNSGNNWPDADALTTVNALSILNVDDPLNRPVWRNALKTPASTSNVKKKEKQKRKNKQKPFR